VRRYALPAHSKISCHKSAVAGVFTLKATIRVEGDPSMAKRIWIQSVVGSLVVLLIAVSSTVGQKIVSGEWTASTRDESGKIQKHADKINLNFDQRSEIGHRRQIGQSYDFSDLQGLSREQVVGGNVRFSLVREAGRIDCEGSFQNGKGSGTYQFTGNQAFVDAMKGRGFDFDDDVNERHSENRLFSATALNVTTALADDLSTAGFGRLGVDDLFKAAIFTIDSRFMREMKASGFPNLGMEDLVKARIFKIDAAFVSQVVQMGFDKEPFESLVKMRIFKVSPEFIAEVRNEGLTNIDVEDLCDRCFQPLRKAGE
jgi:hypothetical protein